MVERTLPPGTVWTYAPGDPDDLAATILAVVDDAGTRDRQVRRAGEAIAALSWEREAPGYLALVERLIAGRAA